MKHQAKQEKTISQRPATLAKEAESLETRQTRKANTVKASALDQEEYCGLTKKQSNNNKKNLKQNKELSSKNQESLRTQIMKLTMKEAQ